MPDTTAWLGVGFLIVWAVLGAYLVRLRHAQRDVSRRLDALEKERGRG